MDQMLSTVPRGREAYHQVAVDNFHEMRRHCQGATLLMSFLAFVMWGMVPVENTIAHTAPDHEIEEQTQALEEEPERIDLWVKRGQLYRSNGNYIEALNDLDRAAELDPEDTNILLERGLTLSALGRDVEAEVLFDQFLDLDDSTVALVARGHIRARTGRESLAIMDFTNAIQKEPRAGLFMARGKAQESLGDLEGAALGYREGLAQLGNKVLLKKALIRAETAQHRYDVAMRLIDEELARVRVKAPWYLQRAELWALKGQVKAAQRDRERALIETNRALGKRPTALHRVYRAKVFISMGRLEDAKRDLELAVQVAPFYAEAGELLASLEGR